MAEWYSRQEVAEKLGVSNSTVYLYERQGKIKKIADPHRLHRHVRYECTEVDELEKNRRRPVGVRPSELAKQLKIPVNKIYTIIKEHQLSVEEFPIGESRVGLSIPTYLVQKIKDIVEQEKSDRGTQSEYFNTIYDIALFQSFVSNSGQAMRVMQNEQREWGFYLQGRSWVSFPDAVSRYDLTAAYSIHHENIRPASYTDFLLPKEAFTTFDFLDFVYQEWGVENIRIRELEESIALSIKSGDREIVNPMPDNLTFEWIDNQIVAGQIHLENDVWKMIGSHKKTTIQLPEVLLNQATQHVHENDQTLSQYIEYLLGRDLNQ